MAVKRFKESSLRNDKKYTSLLAGNNYYVPPSYESIASVTVGAGGSPSIEFTSIPSTYVALELRAIVRGDIAYCLFTFNNDTTTSNYVDHYMQGNGSSAYAGADVNTLAGIGFWNPPPLAATNTFLAGTLDIIDYASTSKYKTVKSINGFDNNGSGVITLQSGLWKSTSAISSLKIVSNGGASYPFLQYSTFALYGIKGA